MSYELIERISNIHCAALEDKITSLDEAVVKAQKEKDSVLREIAKGNRIMKGLDSIESELEKAVKAKKTNEELISVIQAELNDVDIICNSLYSKMRLAYYTAWQPVYEELKAKLQKAVGNDFIVTWIAYSSSRNTSSYVLDMIIDIFGELPTTGQQRAGHIHHPSKTTVS